MIYLKVGRGVERRRRLRRRRARGDRARAGCSGSTRTRPGTRRRRSTGSACSSAYDLDWVEQPTPRRRRQRPRARPALGRREDRGRPGGVHDGQLAARAREGGGRRHRPGQPRRRRAAPLPPAGVPLRRARPARQPARVHGERDQLLRERSGRLDDPQPDAREPDHAPAPRRAADARARRRRSPAAASGPATRPATASSSTTTRSGVAHERWQRDGAYNTVEILERRRLMSFDPSGLTVYIDGEYVDGAEARAPDLGPRPPLRRRDLRGDARSSRGRSSARTTTSRGSPARRARSGSSSRSPATSCST